MGCKLKMLGLRDRYYEILKKLKAEGVDIELGTEKGERLGKNVYRYEFNPYHFTTISYKPLVSIPIPFTKRKLYIFPRLQVCAEVKILYNDKECLVTYYNGVDEDDVENTKALINELAKAGIIDPDKIHESSTYMVRKAWKYPGEGWEY